MTEESDSLIKGLEHTHSDNIDIYPPLLLDVLRGLQAERDEARKAAAHLWYGGEHGVSQEEVCEWYPWVLPLLDEHAREWTETRLASRRELRAEVERLRTELERANEARAAILLGKLTSIPEDLAAVLAERDEARRLARWLYENGGQEVLDASGGGDVSEWPWLTAPARETP